MAAWGLVCAALILQSPVSERAGNRSLLDHLVQLLDIPVAAQSRRNRPIEIFSMALDVTHDGVPELFLGSTWRASREGTPWVVYTREADGRYRPLGFLEFSYETFYYDEAKSRICGPKRAGPGLPGYYACYHTGQDGIHQIMDEPLGTVEENRARADRWQETERPPLARIELRQLRASSATKWQEIAGARAGAAPGLPEGAVSESGDCSAEKLLGEFRNAGCMSVP